MIRPKSGKSTSASFICSMSMSHSCNPGNPRSWMRGSSPSNSCCKTWMFLRVGPGFVLKRCSRKNSWAAGTERESPRPPDFLNQRSQYVVYSNANPSLEVRTPKQIRRFSMIETPVYLDNHATTRVDPRVLEAMLPYFTRAVRQRGQHESCFGWEARDAVDEPEKRSPPRSVPTTREIVFTSGATESNNLAIRGVWRTASSQGQPYRLASRQNTKPCWTRLTKLSRSRLRGHLVPVAPASECRRRSDSTSNQMAEAIRDDTLLVSVMLANNEMGVIQPLAEIGRDLSTSGASCCIPTRRRPWAKCPSTSSNCRWT